MAKLYGATWYTGCLVEMKMLWRQNGGRKKGNEPEVRTFRPCRSYKVIRHRPDPGDSHFLRNYSHCLYRRRRKGSKAGMNATTRLVDGFEERRSLKIMLKGPLLRPLILLPSKIPRLFKTRCLMEVFFQLKNWKLHLSSSMGQLRCILAAPRESMRYATAELPLVKLFYSHAVFFHRHSREIEGPDRNGTTFEKNNRLVESGEGIFQVEKPWRF